LQTEVKAEIRNLKINGNNYGNVHHSYGDGEGWQRNKYISDFDA